jgi:hypothetical protein
MGTIIDDYLQEESETENYKQERLEQSILSHKSSPLIEEALDIHNYLPINRQLVEDNYINHLWDAFLTLDTLGEDSRSFSLMPFHILFMLSLQYKVLRVAKAYEKECNLVFCTAGARDKDKLLNIKKSVFDLAFLNERVLPEFLQLVEVDESAIRSVKALVNYRNDNLAHPKGGIEINPEIKIGEYMDVLEKIQRSFTKMNDDIVEKWSKDLEFTEDSQQYLETHKAEEYLCFADLRYGRMSKL